MCGIADIHAVKPQDMVYISQFHMLIGSKTFPLTQEQIQANQNVLSLVRCV